MEISVIILNWNAAADTIRCVRDVESWATVTPHIFVVDNASQDDSLERIIRECPGVRLICNQENLGFTGGTNQGIKEALAANPAPILLLNNDAYIGEDSVIQLLESLAGDSKIGIIGPLLFDAENKETLISAGGKNPVKHHQTRISTLAPGPAIRKVDYVSGTAVIINPAILNAVGFLDEDYFFSTELADFCMRARRHGYLSVIDTRARAYHTLSRSSSLRNTLYVYYIIRNRFIYIRNASYKFKFGLVAFWAIYSLTLALKLRISGQAASAKAVQLGLTDGLNGRFGGQNERVLRACGHKPLPQIEQSG